MPNKLTVERLPIADLKPSPRNARTHSRKQIEQIAESIRAFGFVNPVLIDEANLVIAGHGRLAQRRSGRHATARESDGGEQPRRQFVDARKLVR